MPKFIINDTTKLLFKLQSAFRQFRTITVFQCCLIKLLPYSLFEKYIYLLALEMAIPRNQHCASCIGTLSFPTLPSQCRGEVRIGVTDSGANVLRGGNFWEGPIVRGVVPHSAAATGKLDRGDSSANALSFHELIFWAFLRRSLAAAAGVNW